MSDDRKPPTPSITGSRLIDVLQAHESRAFRVFWATVGKDAQRRRAAKEAWDRLDALLLPEATFEDSEFDLLTRCIGDELKRQNAVTALPTPALPDAETQVPTSAPPTSPPLPSNSVRQPRKREPSAQTQMALVPTDVVTGDFFSAKVAEFGKDTKAKQTQQLALPVVAEAERAAPNLWLRSALFGVHKKGEREAVERKRLPTPWVKGTLEFSGRELDQGDLDLMLQMVHMAASQGGVEVPIGFTDRGMLKALGKAYGTLGLKWLDESAHRLMQAVVTVDDGSGAIVSFHLLRLYARKSEQRVFVIDKTAMEFFRGATFTNLQWKARLGLKGDLTRWLHGFLTSQPHTVHGVSLALLKTLSGTSPTRPIKKFKADLVVSLRQLLKVEDKHLGLIEASIVDGKEGPKLVWRCQPNRRESLKDIKEPE